MLQPRVVGKRFRQANRKSAVSIAVLSAFYAFAITAGLSLGDGPNVPCSLNPVWLALVFVALTIGFFFLLHLLWNRLDRKAGSREASVLRDRPSNGLVLVCAIVLLGIGWIPVLLAAWPGYFCYDTAHIIDWVTDGSLTTKHSILQTFLVGSFLKLGLGFGSWQIGIALYSVFQMILCGAFVIFMLLRINGEGGFSKPTLIVTCVYFAFNPAIAMFACCQAKDVLFSYALVTFALLIYLSCKSGSVSMPRCFGVAITLFIVLTFRNNAVIAIVLALPWIIGATKNISNQQDRRRLLVSGICGFVSFAIWTAPITNALHPEERPDPMLDIISIPSIEIGRAASYEDVVDDLSKVELDANDLSARYAEAFHDTDFIRFTVYEPFGTKQHSWREFLSLWLGVKLKHPGTCIAAVLELTKAAWYPFAKIDGYNHNPDMGYAYAETPTCAFAAWCEEPGVQQSVIPPLSDALWHLSRFNTLKDSPLSFFIMSIPLYLWLLLLTFARCISTNDRPGKAFCAVLLGTVITFLCGPMVLIRYYFYLIIALPILILILFKSGEEINSKERSDSGTSITDRQSKKAIRLANLD